MKKELKNGFKFNIAEDAIDDLELAEEIAEGDAGNPAGYIKAMKRLLGDDQYDKLKSHLRDEKTGRIKLTVFGDVLTEVIDLATSENDSKNS